MGAMSDLGVCTSDHVHICMDRTCSHDPKGQQVTANFSHACCCETVTVDVLSTSVQVLNIHF